MIVSNRNNETKVFIKYKKRGRDAVGVEPHRPNKSFTTLRLTTQLQFVCVYMLWHPSETVVK